MQVKSVRITSNLMAPSRALDAAHVLLYRGSSDKKAALWLRWLIPSKLQVNTSNVGPEFMNRSNTIKYYSGSPVDFCISNIYRGCRDISLPGRTWLEVSHQQWGPIIGKQFPETPDVTWCFLFCFFLQSLRGFADIVPYNNAVMPNTLNP